MAKTVEKYFLRLRIAFCSLLRNYFSLLEQKFCCYFFCNDQQSYSTDRLNTKKNIFIVDDLKKNVIGYMFPMSTENINAKTVGENEPDPKNPARSLAQSKRLDHVTKYNTKKHTNRKAFLQNINIFEYLAYTQHSLISAINTRICKMILYTKTQIFNFMYCDFSVAEQSLNFLLTMRERNRYGF
ncbi:MAG: hypothetical protein HRT87_05025 [Legionellales bacterium]|nr:hypothetical protein [Legionellales bacterium]